MVKNLNKRGNRPITDLWKRDDIQFPRLLSEIAGVGLTNDQLRKLVKSMDLSSNNINELLQRAERRFEKIKENWL